jgi:hypothetical protein
VSRRRWPRTGSSGRWRPASGSGSLPTGAGAPSLVVDRFALALYPMLEARTGTEVGLSAAQWRRLGQAVARVHAVLVAPLAGLVGRERFRIVDLALG